MSLSRGTLGEAIHAAAGTARSARRHADPADKLTAPTRAWRLPTGVGAADGHGRSGLGPETRPGPASGSRQVSVRRPKGQQDRPQALGGSPEVPSASPEDADRPGNGRGAAVSPPPAPTPCLVLSLLRGADQGKMHRVAEWARLARGALCLLGRCGTGPRASVARGQEPGLRSETPGPPRLPGTPPLRRVCPSLSSGAQSETALINIDAAAEAAGQD